MPFIVSVRPFVPDADDPYSTKLIERRLAAGEPLRAILGDLHHESRVHTVEKLSEAIAIIRLAHLGAIFYSYWRVNGPLSGHSQWYDATLQAFPSTKAMEFHSLSHSLNCATIWNHAEETPEPDARLFLGEVEVT